MQDSRTYRYDVFISYRWISPDLEWVRNQLDPALRNAGLRVCLDVRDFDPGKDKILEMERGGLEARRTLCVISPEYFEEGCLVEFESLTARRRDPAGRNSLLIPLIVRETEIPERFHGLIPITWIDSKTHQEEWRRLLKVLGAPNPDAQPPDSIQTPILRRGPRRQNKKLGILIYVAAALVILPALSVLTIQVFSDKSDRINANPTASPQASPQPTATASPSTTPTPGPSPSARVRSTPARSPRSQQEPKTPCSPKNRLIGNC